MASERKARASQVTAHSAADAPLPADLLLLWYATVLELGSVIFVDRVCRLRRKVQIVDVLRGLIVPLRRLFVPYVKL